MTIEGRGVQSIEVGGRLLAVLVEEAQPLMLRDLAARADLTAAQAHAYLVSFRKLGLVEQDPQTGRYRLGPFALQLGLTRMRSFDPLKLASQAVVDFADAKGLMVTIAVWGTYGPTIVQVQEATDQVHVNLRAGAVFSLTGTATGKAFGAFLPRRVIAQRLDVELREGARSQRVGGVTSRAAFEACTTEVRARGYATTEGVPVPGINAVSVPVFDHGGQMQLAVTVIGPVGRMRTTPDSPELKAAVAFGQSLSAKLGYLPAPPRAEAPAGAPGPDKSAPGKSAPGKSASGKSAPGKSAPARPRRRRAAP